MFKILRMMALCCVIAMFTPYAADAASKKEDSGESGAAYVKMDPLLLPIIDDDGVQQIVSLVVAIAVMNEEDAGKVEAMKPRLNDAYIQNTYGLLNRHAALKGGVIQVSMLKDKLNAVTHDVMGDDVEADVLLQMVQQRPI